MNRAATRDGGTNGAASEAVADSIVGRLVASALLALLAFYKRRISPLLPRACRFTPTCSEYARLAILRHGPWKGVPKAVLRVLRCHPLHPGGVDLP